MFTHLCLYKGSFVDFRICPCNKHLPVTLLLSPLGAGHTQMSKKVLFLQRLPLVEETELKGDHRGDVCKGHGPQRQQPGP